MNLVDFNDFKTLVVLSDYRDHRRLQKTSVTSEDSTLKFFIMKS